MTESILLVKLHNILMIFINKINILLLQECNKMDKQLTQRKRKSKGGVSNETPIYSQAWANRLS